MASCHSSHLFPTTVSLILTLLLLTIVPSHADNIIYGGDTLQTGQSLTYGNYQFLMQADCNLVLYDGAQALWASGTQGRGTTCHATLEMTGELAIFNAGTKIWSSNTAGQTANYVLVLQRDRNVVIYGGAIWATGTAGPSKK